MESWKQHDELDISVQRRERVATMQLFCSTILFGVSFIGQKVATNEGIGPFAYTACRFLVSTILLVIFRPLIQLLIHSEIDIGSRTDSFDASRVTHELYKWGTLCGFGSFGGCNLQQIGLLTVEVGKTAFITGMYVIFVPIVEWILPGFGLRLNWRIWMSAGISLFGMFLLSGDITLVAGGAFSTGEIIVFISMLFWVISIISADVAAKKGVNSVSFTLMEFTVSTILSFILAFTFESESFVYPFGSIVKSWRMILLVGVTEGVSFLLGSLGQMYIAPSRAALIFSMESVTAAVGGYFCLGETLSQTELFGCFLMLSAAVLCSYESDVVAIGGLTVEYREHNINNFLNGERPVTPTSAPDPDIFKKLDSAFSTSLLAENNKFMYSAINSHDRIV